MFNVWLNQREIRSLSLCPNWIFSTKLSLGNINHTKHDKTHSRTPHVWHLKSHEAPAALVPSKPADHLIGAWKGGPHHGKRPIDHELIRQLIIFYGGFVVFF